ncbi:MULTISPECIES: DUF2252 domain-containing protein [unclassified Leifsonia]|uniref:DUF2252 domain-containing protein n=1 Tax=unclassified Leifsonia TaxID=2663824 RepID=UPI0007002A37|nr:MULTISPECIES: DUF2252 domain-containing protein [unclassified Leifsonia]KQX06646.1 hypothetical protein ASC59_01980 [Leifsonia sp. Root1293]KRA10930.1 hypothetical protein ASD61_01980 [Leifsonia sp. Root60]
MSDTTGRLRFDHDEVTRHDELYADGRSRRAVLPRREQASMAENPDRDPLDILERQHHPRLPDLIPLRVHRMLQSPFAFYRGTAAIQVADLAHEPNTGLNVVLCGDAHISNFGIYASPQRTLVFDLNDFDEAASGPWEWDVKRLITSIVIAGRENGYARSEIRRAALTGAAAYRIALRAALELGAIDRYFLHAEVKAGTSRFGPETQKIIDKAVRAARNRTSARVVEKIMTRADDGSLQIVEDRPTLMHIEPELEARLTEIFDAYRASVAPDVALLLSQYTVTDAVRRVVGVGSVGTRCYIAVLTGPRGEPLVLQFKEAARSVVHEFGEAPIDPAPGIDPAMIATEHGFRVIANQRILQAVSDPFLGYLAGEEGRSFYVRQFRDRNVSFDIAALSPGQFVDYADACASLLARAHSQSPAAASISGYLGTGDVFDKAVVAWADEYADRSFADFELLRDAVDSGRFVSSEFGA